MYTLKLNPDTFHVDFADEMDKAFFDNDHSYWRMSNRRHIEKEESENSYIYYIPLPGYKKNDVKASVLKNNILLIVAKKENRKDLVYEFVLPDDVNLSVIESKLEDGLLELNIPKNDESEVINIDIN